MAGNFERARNVQPTRWAGDPERWGGFSAFNGVSRRTSVPVADFGAQVLRAQARDLYAIAWDLAATWEVGGLTAEDQGTLSLELTIGTGQATSTLTWLLARFFEGASPMATPAALAHGYAPADGAPQVIPYTGYATIPAGSAGPVSFSPSVPAGFRVRLLSATVGAYTAAGVPWGRIDTVYVGDSTLVRPAASMTVNGDGGGGSNTNLDWYGPPGDTPAMSVTAALAAGQALDGSVTGFLERVGANGVAVSAQPIIACTINARPMLILANPTADRNVTCKVTAHCAPRSWVP